MNMETVLALQDAGVDTEGALNRFSGNDGLYEKFLLKFLQDEVFYKIGPALDAGDWEAALNAAHTLKGISANLGMDRLFHACADIVILLRENKTEQAKKNYDILDNAYQMVCRILEEMKSE